MDQRIEADHAAPAPPFGAMYRQAIEDFWTMQERLVDSMGCVGAGWCERRRAGVAAARELDVKLLECAGPTDAMRAWQEWASGSAGRLVADGVEAWQQAGAVMTHALSRVVLASMASQRQSAGALAAGWAPAQAAAVLMCVMPTADPLQWPLPGRVPLSA